MSAQTARLPPLDPNPGAGLADADRERRERYLRKLLAEGRESPSRLRLVAAELRALEHARAPGD